MAETTQVMQQETKSGTSFGARQAGRILITPHYVAPCASVNPAGQAQKKRAPEGARLKVRGDVSD
jgi:hypothetical protein